MTPDYLIGVDEVGRGPIAGPLCVGAFLVKRTELPALLQAFKGIRDSKQLSPEERTSWFKRIKTSAQNGRCRFSTIFIRAEIIDRKGMGKALRSAVARVLYKLGVSPNRCFVLLDGTLRAPAHFLLQESIIDGDENEPLIGAASIIAKVRRDKHMVTLSKRFPEYGFEVHKGYGTKKHYEALRKHGLCAIHRKSFLEKFKARNTKPKAVSKS